MLTSRKKIVVSIVLIAVLVVTAKAVSLKTYEELDSIKQVAHQIANQARSIGLKESHDIILSAKQLWHEADEAIKNKEYEVPITIYYEQNWIDYLAKTAYAEARGIKSTTEIACVMWSIMNRYDIGQGSVENIVKKQYAYYSSARTMTDHGCDLKTLAKDVLDRWNQEKNGQEDVGRVLPTDYIYFGGDGKRNYFRNTYKLTGNYWDFSLPSPYES